MLASVMMSNDGKLSRGSKYSGSKPESLYTAFFLRIFHGKAINPIREHTRVVVYKRAWVPIERKDSPGILTKTS